MEEESIEASRRGLHHIDRLPPRWQTMYKAVLDYSTGNYIEAYQALTHLIDTAPDIPDAHYILGEIVTHNSRYWDPRKAIEFFSGALEIDPTFKIALYHLVEDHLLAGDLDAAERVMERYRGSNVADPSMSLVEVQILRARGRYDEAIALGEELIAGGYQARQDTIATLLAAEEWDRAVVLANEGMNNAKGYVHSIILGLRGQAQFGRGRIREGLADTERVIEIFDADMHKTSYMPTITSWIYLPSAVVRSATGNLDEAIAASRRTIGIDPFFAQPYFWLGRILVDAGQMEQAEKTLKQLQTRVEPKGTPVTVFFSRLLAAELHLAKGDMAAARSEIDRAAAMPPEYWCPELELVRARVLAASGDREEAITAYRQVADVYVSLACMSPVVAIQTLALYDVARLEEEVGDLESARRHYRRFLSRWGNADMPIPAVDDAKERLAALEN
jgi:tetratricopeptide (TPR) repeat protein